MHQPGITEDEELIRLQDALPPQVESAVYSCRTLGEAWAKLDLRYGNKSLIAERLKRDIKNLKLKSTTDYDKIIELHDFVEDKVYRLRDLGNEEALRADKEFRSIIFRMLPAQQ